MTMPAYHAGETLEKTLLALPPGLDAHIIVVDDASSDDTVAVAKGLGLTVFQHVENQGYGGNQKTCYEAALESGADIVVMLHPDYQYDPKAVPLLIGPILTGDADATFGSRFAGMSDPREGGMPWFRYYGNKITTNVQNHLLGTNFTELHSGMRAYSRDCLLALPFLGYPNDFDFDSKLLADAITSGQTVVEVPIPTSYSNESSSIAIWPSIRYVTNSVRHALKSRIFSGRKGRRDPIVTPGRWKRSIPSGAIIDLECIVCGSPRHRMVYPSNVPAGTAAEIDEYACTSNVISFHDDIVKCERCNIVRSIWQLDQDDIVDAYEQTEDTTYTDQEEGRRELFSWVLERMERYSTDRRRLVEFGSHLGMFLDEAQKKGWEATGIEPSKWAVEHGRELYGVDLRQGTIESAEREEEPHDVAVMLDMLEHVTDPIAALISARDMVAYDGLVAVTTIDFSSVHARIRGKNWPWMIRPHLWYFTPDSLVDVFERSGLEPVEWATVPRDFNLSYVVNKGGENLGMLGRIGALITKVIDPRIPTGLLGDIILVIARPSHTNDS
ncbi:MAG: glycosyltransferase [Acidimicrobiales bacterium]|nr:glycosyltransferase [Acidimicrobiales bacterium]